MDGDDDEPDVQGPGLLRASVLVPWAIPTAVTAKLWFFMFAFDGIVNGCSAPSILWTGDAWPARFAIIVADVWKTTPFMALLILAGLQIIPGEVYEAAKIDGATPWQTLHPDHPAAGAGRALLVAVLFRMLDVLRIYDLPAILTGGGATAPPRCRSWSSTRSDQGSTAPRRCRPSPSCSSSWSRFLLREALAGPTWSGPSSRSRRGRADDGIDNQREPGRATARRDRGRRAGGASPRATVRS